MVNFLLDTNIVLEIRKREKCNANVAEWFETVEENEIFLSVLTLGEIRKGIERISPKNNNQARSLELWLTEIHLAFGERILPINERVCNEWGQMCALRSIPVVDGLLVATAKVNQMTLVTRNVADVHDLGARIINPFDKVSVA